MDSADFIDKIFDEMFLLQEAACAKRGSECCRHQRASSSSSNGTERDSDTFTKKMMVLRSFKPEEIQIRVTKDKKVVVEAKQEMKKDKDGGFQSYQMRKFKQTLDVPENVDIEQLSSSISQDGVLTISAPFLALPEPEKLDVNQANKNDSDISNNANDSKMDEST